MITIEAIDRAIAKKYKFIDLFAGIGGFHLALSAFGLQCVFACESDKYAAQVYEKNFHLQPQGDINHIHASNIPAHQIVCAGFPCQAFSIAGKQKGFSDTRGTLFFQVVRIIEWHQPAVIFLENVKNLVRHDQGKTFAIVVKTLESLDYQVFYQIFNASDFALPQNRQRIYIVAFHKNINAENFIFPQPTYQPVCLQDILENDPADAKIIQRDDINIYKNYLPEKLASGEIKLLNKPIQIGKVNKGGQGERIYHPLGHAITLSANGGGIGAKTGLYLINDQVRKLSPRECARLQGFPDSFLLDASPSQAYKQLGNSVAINVLQSIFLEIYKILKLSQPVKSP
jgi:DNA (cytosine-5)-methyltransferase 1